MHIGLTKFFEEELLEIEYNADNAICGNCLSLDWYNTHEKEVAKKANNKDNNKKILK